MTNTSIQLVSGNTHDIAMETRGTNGVVRFLARQFGKLAVASSLLLAGVAAPIQGSDDVAASDAVVCETESSDAVIATDDGGEGHVSAVGNGATDNMSPWAGTVEIHLDVMSFNGWVVYILGHATNTDPCNNDTFVVSCWGMFEVENAPFAFNGGNEQDWDVCFGFENQQSGGSVRVELYDSQDLLVDDLDVTIFPTN